MAPTDFVNVWAAGQLVLQGNPAAAYDWPTHKAMELVALGHPFEGYFGWHYPPTFLPVAALLAKMSYVPAQIIFLVSTFCAYLFCLRGILGERTGFFIAAAFPAVLANSAVLANFIAGQVGFLSPAADRVRSCAHARRIGAIGLERAGLGRADRRGRHHGAVAQPRRR